ncbi:MCE family protein [Mycolicibacterium confluentis]|uniref:Virulence factor n=1 Tax=Mycolicibacterium confluentis TaxID=28047 RepID=A0A7I7XSY8_9MYCO|nr:MCE family protein [Mycolicibacterium confluentis]MCV7321325.1 MCE family protein [Mycolicibacterium confluentis]ORV25207.1 MCE-family protein MCE3A [Mycolicibacterium confluentis]BBZ32193.1 virulence factor [Mycolicibacterium confluentis]
MEEDDKGLHPAWWTAILIAFLAGLVWLTSALFTGSLKHYVNVTVTSDRSGLVMESGAKVKMRGVQVGRVTTIKGGQDPVRLNLEIYPDQVKYIPANVGAQIRATTVFGAKFVDLIYPDDPESGRLADGQVLMSQNVSTEVNTVFQNLVGVLDQVDSSKLNATLAALAEGVRGQGERIGEATTAANQVLLELNPRADTIRADWQALDGFNQTYSAAAQNIVGVLDALSTTSTTITENAKPLDALLLNVIGLSNSGIALLAPNQENLIKAINVLEPTTNLLMKYNPGYTCMLTGAHWLLENGAYEATGGNGKSFIVDGGALLGDDQYRYPENLPIIGAKGGPGGQPGCGSLPNVDENWPVRALVTNTGWGTGVDIRPNPGIAFPMWANYFPTTRGIPQPPSIRNLFGGPAPGPNAGNPPKVIPEPGDYPYGAPMYGPDGTPLWNNLPPAPPPGAPKDPGPRPGTEPFVVPNPGQVPTPYPPNGIPVPAAPSP